MKSILKNLCWFHFGTETKLISCVYAASRNSLVQLKLKIEVQTVAHVHMHKLSETTAEFVISICILKVLFRSLVLAASSEMIQNPCTCGMCYISQPVCMQTHNNTNGKWFIQVNTLNIICFWLLLLDEWSWHWRWLFMLLLFFSVLHFISHSHAIYTRCLFDSLWCRKHNANQDNACLLAESFFFIHELSIIVAHVIMNWQ